MKKHHFFLIIAAAVVMGATISCSKDDGPEVPEVIKSDVLDSGVDEHVQAVSGTDGSTSLSYKSWILVNQITRSGDNRIETPVQGNLAGFKETVGVGSFESGAMRTETSYIEEGRSQAGYVVLVDSAVVHHVAYDNFSFDYVLRYQSPLYADGHRTEQMPYYRIESVKDNGGQFGDMSSGKNEKGDVCAYQKYTHSVSVLFHGEWYDVKAEILLEKVLSYNGEPCVVKSKILSEGLTVGEGGSGYSWVEVEQTWSTGEIIPVKVGINVSAYVYADLEMGKILPDANIVRKKGELRDKDSFISSASGKYVVKKQVNQLYVIDYNYFSLSFEVVHDEAYYDDGYLHYAMPSFKCENIQEVPFVISELGESTVDGGKPCTEYDFTQKLTVDINGVSYESVHSLAFFVLK